MLETKREKVLSRRRFLRRQAAALLLGGVALVLALALGVGGYHWIAKLRWIDSLLNASMILGGMGPVDPLPNDAAKVFASCYALFSGVMFISIMAVILGPSVHRLLHKFHAEGKE